LVFGFRSPFLLAVLERANTVNPLSSPSDRHFTVRSTVVFLTSRNTLNLAL